MPRDKGLTPYRDITRPYNPSEWVIIKRTKSGAPSQWENVVTRQPVSERTMRHLRSQKIKGEKGYQEYAEKQREKREKKKREKQRERGVYWKKHKPDSSFGLGSSWVFNFQTRAGNFTEYRDNLNLDKIEQLINSFPNNRPVEIHLRANVYGGANGDNPDEWPWRSAPVGAGVIQADFLKRSMAEYEGILNWLSEGNGLKIEPYKGGVGIAELHVVMWERFDPSKG